MEPSPEIIAKLNELNGWSVERRNSYQRLEEQLDMLFHDIDAGLLGEQAKTGQFYIHVKNIKDNNPKPSSEQLSILEQELQTLINQQENG
jgi:hypothetical protein